ncbi:pantoate--beta-alanine ligase [Candidatus Pelagibacter sp.]|nr:pantoate--beta-alanine ligase [Candidatus Pelagibacter sp.]
MKVLKNIADLKSAINRVSDLGFVPTMGGLHKGHISLIKKSQKECKVTLVSIYINPKQFNKSNDFLTYPRNLHKDFKILKKLKVNLLFLPKTREVFKKDYKTNMLFKNQKILCAKFRKGHFEGVLDVMEQFIKLINPKYIFMGEKDYQQLFLVKSLVLKKYNSKVFHCKTIRDKNFVALSTRNFLLSKKKLLTAGLIAKNLYRFKSKLKKIKNVNRYILIKKEELVSKFGIKIEYLEVLNESDLKKYKYKNKFKLFIAYYLDKIRLIDNF